MNLGDHVGDQPSAVALNRSRLLDEIGVQHAQWLTQVHGNGCIESDGLVHEADACWTDQAGLACVIMTADCLPVVFTDGDKVAAAHAGWRGLADGVLESTLAQFSGAEVYVWLGPAIGPSVFEVGEEVRQQFCDHLSPSVDCFRPSENKGKWLADLYQLARLRLLRAGVQHISGGSYCTYSDPTRFFSYRREQQTGRMATLIWKTEL